ncbi:MAG: helix-turn-helix transcriptional regulator [Deltaproteobacteria bacterium]|nr:helix-turn-helix transcriptional regulator [Deltaproteobacteria bacterium]
MPGQSKQALIQLGERLRSFRLERDETQKRFAARLRVSVPTYQKLETGDPTVNVGLWIEAIKLLDRIPDLDYVLAEKRSLFEQYESRQVKKRRRASRKKENND